MAYFTYDSEADAVYLKLREPDGGERGCRQLDEKRLEVLDHAGKVFAYEFLFVRGGISLDGIEANAAARIREALEPVRRLAVS